MNIIKAKRRTEFKIKTIRNEDLFIYSTQSWITFMGVPFKMMNAHVLIRESTKK